MSCFSYGLFDNVRQYSSLVRMASLTDWVRARTCKKQALRGGPQHLVTRKRAYRC